MGRSKKRKNSNVVNLLSSDDGDATSPIRKSKRIKSKPAKYQDDVTTTEKKTY